MYEYKAAYLKLFNEVTDIIEALKKAQEKAEKLFIFAHNDPLSTVRKTLKEKSPKEKALNKRALIYACYLVYRGARAWVIIRKTA